MLASLIKSVVSHRSFLKLSRSVTVRPRAAILCYHSVAERSDHPQQYLSENLTVAPEAFERQIRFLSQHYSIVQLESLVDCLRSGHRPDRDSVAITFDDGYRDNYEHAFPILRRHGVSATFYLTTGCIENLQLLWTAQLRYVISVTHLDNLQLNGMANCSFDLSTPQGREDAFTMLVVHMKNIPTPQRLELLEVVCKKLQVNEFLPLGRVMMSWNQMREMHREGMSFGAHTVTHPNLPNTELEEARQEIQESKQMLEDQLGGRVDHFAYPNGRGSSHLTQGIKELVREAGFCSAVTSQKGCVQSGDDLFSLRRIGVYKKHSSLTQFSWDIERCRWNR